MPSLRCAIWEKGVYSDIANVINILTLNKAEL